MDDADRAKQLEMQQRSDALERQQARAQITETPQVIDGVRVCIDCDEPIPVARLVVQPASVRCVPCKTIFESRNR